LLQWTFEQLGQNGIKEVVLAVNKQTEFYLKQYRPSKCGLIVKYSRDPPKMPLGTAGPIKKAEKLIGHDEPFLVLNGDLLTDIKYTELIEQHKKGNAIATIALHEVDNPSRYGVAELAEKNRIKRFIEKPACGTEPTKLINAGVYIVSPKIFDYIPADRAVSMEREVFPKLCEEGKLYGHITSGLWIDIGKPEDYLQTNKLIMDSLPDRRIKYNGSKTELKNPVVIDKGVSIGENCVIGPYVVLGKNISLGKNVHIQNSVIFQDTKIDDNASIDGALIGEGAHIGKGTKITKGCIVADQAKVNCGITLPEGFFVCPAKEVSENILKSNNMC
jgi:mannose-1-phosphate guanylyltransferase